MSNNLVKMKKACVIAFCLALSGASTVFARDTELFECSKKPKIINSGKIIHSSLLARYISDEIELVEKNFPNFIDRLLVVNKKETIYVSKGIVDILTIGVGCAREAVDDYPDIKSVIERERNYINIEKVASVITDGYQFRSEYIEVIAINEDKEFYPYSNKYTRDMKVTSDFYHEMGHLLTKNGFARVDSLEQEHIAECAAEAYKAIRHKQIFGNDTDYAANNNSSHLIVGGISSMHYKNIINKKIEALAKEIDLLKLSYIKTIELADEIAIKYHYSEATLTKLERIFDPVFKYYNEVGNNETAARECFEIMIRHSDDLDIYRAGKSFLENPKVKKDINVKDRYWVDVYATMDWLEKKNKIILDEVKLADIRLGSRAVTVDTVNAIISGINDELSFPNRNVLAY